MKNNHEVNLEDTINSGQVFLWKKINSKWYGIDGKKILILGNALDNSNKITKKFFRFDDDFQKIKKQLSKDKIVKKAIKNVQKLTITEKNEIAEKAKKTPDKKKK